MNTSMQFSASFALKENDRDLLQIVYEGVVEESIFPTPENMDLRKKQPFLNGIVLQELANRARNGYDPTQEIAEYYEIIGERYDASPPDRLSY